MKYFSMFFIAVVILSMTACNNQPKPEAAAPVADTVKPAPAKPVFQPYKAQVITQTVKDFDKWLVAFNAHDSIRQASGIKSSAVGRGLDNDKWVIVSNEVSDMQKAKDFAASPNLKEVMKKAGVTGTPTFGYWDVIRDDTSTIPQHERVMVKHHVKDFDTWLKAYDAEGIAGRAEHGMIDRFMARDMDDPNTVVLLFAITDMAKAKARVNSPELKKVMTDAGVDGKPEITYFKWVQM